MSVLLSGLRFTYRVVSWVGRLHFLTASVPAVGFTLCPFILLQMVAL